MGASRGKGGNLNLKINVDCAGGLMPDHLEHIADQAGFLASLPKEDPERKLAEEHTRSCVTCREALDEGTRLVTMLQRELSSSATAAVPAGRASRRSIDTEMATEKGDSRRLAWVTVGAAAVAWLFQLMVGGGFDLDFDCAAVSLSVFAIAVVSITLMRGRPRLVVAVALVTSGLLAYLSGTAAGLEPGIGTRCAFRELWGAGIMWTIVMFAGRRAGVKFGRWDVTAVAAAGALAAHAGQHLACKVPHSEAHLLVFHFGGVVLATLLGAASVGRWTAMTARS